MYITTTPSLRQYPFPESEARGHTFTCNKGGGVTHCEKKKLYHKRRKDENRPSKCRKEEI